jgi:hypothetical protein
VLLLVPPHAAVAMTSTDSARVLIARGY